MTKPCSLQLAVKPPAGGGWWCRALGVASKPSCSRGGAGLEEWRKGGEQGLVPSTAARWRRHTVWQNQIYSLGASSVGGVWGRGWTFLRVGDARGGIGKHSEGFKFGGHFTGAPHKRNE